MASPSVDRFPSGPIGGPALEKFIKAAKQMAKVTGTLSIPAKDEVVEPGEAVAISWAVDRSKLDAAYKSALQLFIATSSGGVLFKPTSDSGTHHHTPSELTTYVLRAGFGGDLGGGYRDIDTETVYVEGGPTALVSGKQFMPIKSDDGSSFCIRTLIQNPDPIDHTKPFGVEVGITRSLGISTLSSSTVHDYNKLDANTSSWTDCGPSSGFKSSAYYRFEMIIADDDDVFDSYATGWVKGSDLVFYIKV